MTEKEVVGSGVTDPTAQAIQLATDLRTALRGNHWGYSNQLLEMLEWVCATDRVYDKARGRALKLINDEERSMHAIINRLVKDPAMAKETK